MSELGAATFPSVSFDFALADRPDRADLPGSQTAISDLLAQSVRREVQPFGSVTEGQHGERRLSEWTGYVSTLGSVPAVPCGPLTSIPALVATPAVGLSAIPSRLRQEAVAPRVTTITAVCSGPIFLADLTPIGVSPVYGCTLRPRRENVKREIR